MTDEEFQKLADETLDHAKQIEAEWRLVTHNTEYAGMPSPTALLLRRLIQELLSTRIKHAHAVVNYAGFNLLDHLERQSKWSAQTFGPGRRTAGVIDHIRKELAEIEAKPDDLMEWVDVIILAFDGAWRMGAAPGQIIQAIAYKQRRNEERQWPDWRTADPDKAIEHIKGQGS